MTRKFRLWSLCFFAIAAILGGVAYLAWMAVHRVPEFYARALAVQPEQQKPASDALLRKTTALTSDLRKKQNTWQALFTVDQINAWLAVDLPLNHPHTLPSTLSEPRVDIQPGSLTVAARYEGPLGSSVLSLETDVFLPADAPDTIALRIKKLRVGALPIGMHKVLEGLERAAKDADWQLQRLQIDGDPVLYFSPPLEPEGEQRAWHIDKVDLRAGEIFISGHTGQK